MKGPQESLRPHIDACRSMAPYGCVGLCTFQSAKEEWSISLARSLCTGRVHFLKKEDAEKHSKLSELWPVAHALRRREVLCVRQLNFSQPMKDGAHDCARAALLFLRKDTERFPVLLLLRPDKATKRFVSSI